MLTAGYSVVLPFSAESSTSISVEYLPSKGMATSFLSGGDSVFARLSKIKTGSVSG